jgi:hypothetical protein
MRATSSAVNGGGVATADPVCTDSRSRITGALSTIISNDRSNSGNTLDKDISVGPAILHSGYEENEHYIDDADNS